MATRKRPACVLPRTDSKKSDRVEEIVEEPTIHPLPAFLDKLNLLIQETQNQIKGDNNLWTVDLEQLKCGVDASVSSFFKSVRADRYKLLKKQKREASDMYTAHVLKLPGYELPSCGVHHCPNKEPLHNMRKLVCEHYLCECCYDILRKWNVATRSIIVKCPLCRKENSDVIPEHYVTTSDQFVLSDAEEDTPFDVI